MKVRDIRPTQSDGTSDPGYDDWEFNPGKIYGDDNLYKKWYQYKKQVEKRFEYLQRKLIIIHEKRPMQMHVASGIHDAYPDVQRHPERFWDFKVQKRPDASGRETWSVFVPKSNPALVKIVFSVIEELNRVVEKWKRADKELDHIDSVIRQRMYD